MSLGYQLTMMIKCSTCWEEKCTHFESKKSPIEKKFFQKDKYELSCHCGAVYVFEYKDQIYVSSCPTCKFKVLVSKQTITDTDLGQFFKTPRNKCLHCDQTGILKMKKFITCHNCCGSGGLICMSCRGTGYLGDTICYCCKGKRWEDKCGLCRGYKVLTAGLAEYECHHCVKP